MRFFRQRSRDLWHEYAEQARQISAQLHTAEDPSTSSHARLAQALYHFYTTPPPALETPLATVPFLAVDVETTGLDAERDRLLSVGMVAVNGRAIPLSTADHWLVRYHEGNAAVGQSATIHGITDTQLENGRVLTDILTDVVNAAAGRVLLAHLALIEHDFISIACERAVGVPWKPARVVDTMDLERRSAVSFGRRPGRGEVRLMNARYSRGLPTYHNHDAVIDAIACAELYLAQTSADHFGADLGSIIRKKGTTRW
ncbi:exonuclease domain-containing protein [Corynebacterium kroppenstedtii]|uniref:exonuclease domain-containing protein n=1 Tax=Corynebacterium sp. PCR 32 TaxID=3351342 RepID=UPI0030A0F6FD